MKDAQTALADALTQTGLPALSTFSTTLDKLASAFANAAQQAKSFREESIRAIAGGVDVQAITQNATFKGPDGKTYNQGSQEIYGNVPTPDKRPLVELEGLPKTKGSSGSKRGQNAYADEVASIKERTAVLRESTAAQAAINPLIDDYGYAAAKATAEQQLLADAQRSGLKVTPQLRENITGLAMAYADASVEAKKVAESQDEIRKRAEEWMNLEKDVLGGFIKDLSKGKSAADALADALGKIGNKLLDMALNDIFPTGGSKSGGGDIFGSLFSGFGKMLGFASGTANTGGRRGQPIGVVHGQEAVIPLPQGGKVPVLLNTPKAPDMRDMVKASPSITINIPIDAKGADAAGLARVEKSVNDLKRTLPGTIVTTVNDATRRRLIK